LSYLYIGYGKRGEIMPSEPIVCEVLNCNKPATIFVRDIQEIEIIPTRNYPWREFEPIDPPHCFCKFHKRASITFPINGNQLVIPEGKGELNDVNFEAVLRRVYNMGDERIKRLTSKQIVAFRKDYINSRKTKVKDDKTTNTETD